MIVFEDLGIPLTHQKITPGNNILSSLSTMYKYTEWTVSYTSGGTTEIVAGDWIVGATSSAKGRVLSITLASGTWAGGDAAGVIRFTDAQSSTGAAAAWTSAENILVAAGTDDATLTLLPVEAPASSSYLIPKGSPAKSVLIVVYANTALTGLTGAKPNQSALAGVPMTANSSITLRNYEAIKNFKCIDYTAASASIVQITYFF